MQICRVAGVLAGATVRRLTYRGKPHRRPLRACPAPQQDGLAQQLLGVVVAHERPDLEASRLELVADTSANKALLAKLEDTLLRELSNATGEGACGEQGPAQGFDGGRGAGCLW